MNASDWSTPPLTRYPQGMITTDTSAQNLKKSAAFGELLRLRYTRRSASAILAAAREAEDSTYHGKAVTVTWTEAGYTVTENET